MASSAVSSRPSPVFEETLEYFLPPGDLRSRRLEVSVCSERGLLGRNVALGRCLVSLAAVHAAIYASPQQKPPQEAATVTDWHVLHPTNSASPFHRSTAVTRSLASSRSTPSHMGDHRRPIAVSMGGSKPRRAESRNSLNAVL